MSDAPPSNDHRRRLLATASSSTHSATHCQWSPRGFDAYCDFYPATRFTPPQPELDRTGVFIEGWSKRGQLQLPASLAVVLVPGLFAEWLPGVFADAKQSLLTSQARVTRCHVRTAYSITRQAARLSEQIRRWLKPDETFIGCAHSKGALDLLWALKQDPWLRERCQAVALMQVPVQPSAIIESAIKRSPAPPLTLSQRLTQRLLYSSLARGALDCTSQRNSAVVDWLANFWAPVPVVHAVSWSVQPTSWVDSYHDQLNRIQPGVAHDGQFYLNDQVLSECAQVCLPQLDHAQPVLGGGGLDVGALWRTLAWVAWRESQSF